MSGDVIVWPNGTIEFGEATIDGERIVAIRFDTVERRSVELRMPFANFVTLADQMRMVADTIVDGSF